MATKMEDLDIYFMQRALQLAKLGGVKVAPNPMVGAVITHDHKIIGEGYHRNYGAPHAEVNAVNSVKDFALLSEATLYVTLEPCSHVGKTPPCSDLIVAHQFKRVVVACLDSNSKVSGKGIKRIKEAGIEVEIGLLEKEARELNRRFFTFHEKKRPYVVLKWAETRDGFMDRLPEDREKGINWITHPRMKMYVHKWRSEEQAIMVGWRTINNDNPQLNVREISGNSPHRFVIAPHGKVNTEQTVFTDGNPTTVISLKDKIEGLPAEVELITLEKIDSASLLTVLYEKNMLSVFIEGGAETHKRFIADNLWDEAYQLIGNVNFERGLKAPALIEKTLIESKDREGNLILRYRNRS